MSELDPISLEAADNLLTKARFRLEARGDRDFALATASQVYEKLEQFEVELAGSAKLADLYGRLYALLQDVGDDERCEVLVQRALALEATLDPPRPLHLGSRQLFYAKFLHRLHRYGEAARMATEGLATYARGVPAGDRELAYLRTLMAPIQRDALAHPPS